jgi:hypothetical protein
VPNGSPGRVPYPLRLAIPAAVAGTPTNLAVLTGTTQPSTASGQYQPSAAISNQPRPGPVILYLGHVFLANAALQQRALGLPATNRAAHHHTNRAASLGRLPPEPRRHPLRRCFALLECSVGDPPYCIQWHWLRSSSAHRLPVARACDIPFGQYHFQESCN